MEGNEEGRGKGREGEKFNEYCLEVFLSMSEKDLKGFEGVRYPSKPPTFNSPNLGHLEGEKRRVNPLIFKKI
jgi:hypothetical protein